MTAQVDVQITCDEVCIPDSDLLSEWAKCAIEAADHCAGTEVSIRVVDAVEIQELNRKYRRIDKPTNVLSFPAGEIEGLPPNVEQALGDVVVCASVVRDESKQQGKVISDHWAHMIVHGTLHLLGFEHETDDQAVAMERLETHILTSIGVADPYGESLQET